VLRRRPRHLLSPYQTLFLSPCPPEPPAHPRFSRSAHRRRQGGTGRAFHATPLTHGSGRMARNRSFWAFLGAFVLAGCSALEPEGGEEHTSELQSRENRVFRR